MQKYIPCENYQLYSISEMLLYIFNSQTSMWIYMFNSQTSMWIYIFNFQTSMWIYIFNSQNQHVNLFEPFSLGTAICSLTVPGYIIELRLVYYKIL